VTVLVAACHAPAEHKVSATDQLLALVDWHILLMFMALFVVSAAFQATGYGSSGAVDDGNRFRPGRPANWLCSPGACRF